MSYSPKDLIFEKEGRDKLKKGINQITNAVKSTLGPLGKTVLIESKASGLPLTYELRNMGIPVVNFTPSRGNDKHTRVNSVAPLFESGMIWAPTHKNFAQEVIEECAAFPYGDHDDLVDSMTQAVMRFRQGGLIPHPEDYNDQTIIKTKKVYY